MPEENDDDKIEEEMLRMMQEESGEAGEEAETEAEPGAEAQDAEAGEAGGDDADLESQMLAAMLQESGDEPDTPQTMMPSQGLDLGDRDIPPNVARLLDVDLSVSIELGRAEESISTVLEWTEGSLIELSKVSGDAVDVLVNGKMFARGEVVTIAENFGVRLTEILPRIAP
jgi:flagellar motor switch protein FliN/FliY